MIITLRNTLRTLNYGNFGIFLIMGNARFISSAVCRTLLTEFRALDSASRCYLRIFVAVQGLRSLLNYFTNGNWT